VVTSTPLRDHNLSVWTPLGNEAEATPLGLKDPPFIVEGFVDESCEHRSVTGTHGPAMAPLRRCPEQIVFIDLLCDNGRRIAS
jgi:hypothetical protein